MKKVRISSNLIALSLVTFLIISCNKKDNNPDNWSIPLDEVQDGGPGKDGIPSLEEPSFTNASGASYLTNSDLVLGYVSGNQVKAYPHNILDWHEIINDKINGKYVCINYCPLTGTGMNWDPNITGGKSEFGVSGMLYNTNVILYDRNTDSNWSQLLLECVNGDLRGEKAKVLDLIETTWGTWKEMYPDTKVVSEDTGFDRNYTQYPYGDYRTNHNNIIFPVNNNDDRLPSKERVHAIIINGNVKAYPINSFDEQIKVIEDSFNGRNIVVAGSKSKNLVISFNRTLADGTELNFTPIQGELPIILEDSEGTTWDVFGRGVDGPRAGEQLQPITSLIGYWFAFAAFYPNLELY